MVLNGIPQLPIDISSSIGKFWTKICLEEKGFYLKKLMTPYNWLEIDDLAKGLMCSKKSVYNYRDDGIFVAGVHYYSVGTGKVRGKHIYCLELCRQALIERTKRQQQKIEKAETYSKEEISKRIDRQIKPSQLSYRG